MWGVLGRPQPLTWGWVLAPPVEPNKKAPISDRCLRGYGPFKIFWYNSWISGEGLGTARDTDLSLWAAVERGGDTLKGFKDSYLKARSGIRT